jgi:hypothetical protein
MSRNPIRTMMERLRKANMVSLGAPYPSRR